MAQTKNFSPAQKAAIIMASLGEDLAPSVFRALNKDDAAKIARSLQNMGRLEFTDIEGVLKEFIDLLQAPASKILDGRDFLKKMGEKNPRAGDAWAHMKAEYSMRVFDRARPDLLFRVIANETPQTLALILSHAPSAFGAPLLKLFSTELRLQILLRMAQLREVDPDIIEELDNHLVKEIDKLGSTGQQKIGGAKKVAEILNALEIEAPALLSSIAERDPELASEIEQEMFTFEDLVKLELKGIQELVKTVKREVLIMSMRGAPEIILKKFVASMSERSGSMFREDLVALGGQKKSDVLVARTQILALTREMIENGKISLESDLQNVV